MESAEEHYAAYGEFGVKFEWVCDSLRRSMMYIMSVHGLRKQGISQLLLADMTAEPLRSHFASMISECYELDGEGKRILKNLLDRFQKLISERNNIIHGHWFMGSEDPDGLSASAHGFKPHRTQDGARAKQFKMSAAQFKELAIEAESLAFLFWRFAACLGEGFEPKKNFRIDKSGRVSERSGG